MDINGGFTAILMGHFIYFMHCHVWLPKVSMDQLWWSPWLSHQFWAGQILDVHPGYPNLFVSSNMARAGKGRFVGRNGAIDDVNYIMEKSSNGGFSNAPCLSTDSTRGELGSRIKHEILVPCWELRAKTPVVPQRIPRIHWSNWPVKNHGIIIGKCIQIYIQLACGPLFGKMPKHLALLPGLPGRFIPEQTILAFPEGIWHQFRSNTHRRIGQQLSHVFPMSSMLIPSPIKHPPW